MLQILLRLAGVDGGEVVVFCDLLIFKWVLMGPCYIGKISTSLGLLDLHFFLSGRRQTCEQPLTGPAPCIFKDVL